MRADQESRITIKTPADFEKMEVAGRIVEGVLNLLGENCKVGVSTLELDQMAYDYIKSQGAYPSFLNYCGYPNSVCTSVNSQVVHGIPGKYRLKDGDIISCDVGACINGFHGDAARTFLVGNVPQEIQDLVRVTKECFFKGFEQCIVGNRIGDIATAIQKHAESHGYGVVRELVGHGIGRQMHEPPDVPNFWDKRMFGHGARLEAGMAIAIEPMITLGSREICELDDGWTIETVDGLAAAHYENTILITPDGPRMTTLHEEEPA